MKSLVKIRTDCLDRNRTLIYISEHKYEDDLLTTSNYNQQKIATDTHSRKDFRHHRSSLIAQNIRRKMIYLRTEALNDIQLALLDPFFHDVKIEATDGELRVNRTILSMRSLYFRSMFNMDNFEEGGEE